MTIPTFTAVVENGFAVFVCPVCGKRNHHTTEDGHRHPHCRCWPGGYRIEVKKSGRKAAPGRRRS